MTSLWETNSENITQRLLRKHLLPIMPPRFVEGGGGKQIIVDSRQA